MEELIVTQEGDDLWKITCDTKQRYTLFFLWEGFIKSLNDSITDYHNATKIDERAAEKTSKLSEENNSLKNTVTSQGTDISIKGTKIITLEEQINTMRDNHKEDILQAVNNSKEATNDLTTHLKNQINEMRQDKIELNERINELNTNLLNKNNKSSHAIGIIGENKLLDLLREEYGFSVKDTHGSIHMGDAEVLYHDMRLCIDAKQYNSTCPHKESTKLISDVEKNNYDGGVLLSWDSGIYDPQTSSKIQDLIFHKIIDGKPYLFISNASSIPDSLLISSIKQIYNNKLSNNSQNNIQINEKITNELSKMIYSELKDLDASDKSLKTTERRNNERRKELNSLIKDYKLSSKPVTTSQNDIVTGICNILNEIKQEYKTQRNSIRDIKQYVEGYIEKNTISYHKFTESDLKKALEQINITYDKRNGKNYLGKQRKKDTFTWSIELPDLLN